MQDSSLKDLLAELNMAKTRALADVEDSQSKQRDNLRNAIVSLREAGEPAPQGPASFSNPSFKIGEVKEFPGVTETKQTQPVSGHLAPEEFKSVLDHLANASRQQDPVSRDSQAGAAAKEVSNSWAKQNETNNNPSFLREARAQVAFHTAELAQAAGIAEPQAKVIGFAFERALEKEGFKVLAHHAIDKVADLASGYKPSSSSAALATGNQAQAESVLAKSADWLADKGVTRDTLQKAVKEHAGKFQIIAAAASNPEAVQQVARTIAKSDSLLDGIMAISKDSELRKAVGTLTMAAGEAASTVNKGIGSAAIVTGALVKGESADEMGRHAFRMGLSILGGAAGGVAAASVSAGFGTIAGAAAGQYLGDKIADKVLEAYDKFTGNDNNQNKSNMVSREEITQSTDIVKNRVGDAASDATKDAVKDLKLSDRGTSMGR